MLRRYPPSFIQCTTLLATWSLFLSLLWFTPSALHWLLHPLHILLDSVLNRNKQGALSIRTSGEKSSHIRHYRISNLSIFVDTLLQPQHIRISIQQRESSSFCSLLLKHFRKNGIVRLAARFPGTLHYTNACIRYFMRILDLLSLRFASMVDVNRTVAT